MKKMIFKISTTLFSIIGVGLICSYLYLLGAFENKSMLGSIFILLGIILLVIGQIMMLYAIWEDKDEKSTND
jgi:uncharacterized membrane protein